MTGEDTAKIGAGNTSPKAGATATAALNNEISAPLGDQAMIEGELLAINQRNIIDMILIWEKQMNQIIYADREGYFVYDETNEKFGRDKIFSLLT